VTHRTAAQLLVECLAAEGCEYVFSVPGEETMDILDALGLAAAARRHGATGPGAPRHVTTRHEQGAAFMADVYGRLTGRPAVALATLGPGATNLLTGIADAYLDRAPMVAITGQASSDKLHKEAHQVVDIVRMFEPVTKWNTRVERVDAVPEIVRKAFKVAMLEKPGPTHIELPENVAAMPPESGDATRPLVPAHTYFPEPTDEAIAHAARLLAASERPIVLAGNGVLRRGVAGQRRLEGGRQRGGLIRRLHSASGRVRRGCAGVRIGADPFRPGTGNVRRPSAGCRGASQGVPRATAFVRIVPKVVLGAAEVVPSVSNSVPGATKVVPGATEVVPGVTKMVPDATKVVSSVTKMVPTVAKMVPGATKLTLVASQTSLVASRTSLVLPGTTLVTSGTSLVASGTSLVTS
jgi:hypothetical protein